LGGVLHSPLAFFPLTFALSWTLFGVAAWLAAGPASGASPNLIAQLFVPGAFGPALVAIWLTARTQGRPGLRALLRPVLQADVPVRWYVFAVGYMAAIKLTVAVLHRAGTGVWPRFGQESWWVIAVAIMFSTPFQAGEEIGWRGFALPRLAERLGLVRASLSLGVIWALWHLPLFYIPATDTYHQSFPLYLAQVTALSVAVAWLWERTNRSLLLVMLLHSAGNQTIGIVPSATADPTGPWTTRPTLVGWLTVSLLWICAGYFLARMPARAKPPGSSPVQQAAPILTL
jgi:membrane protease YdiL (CAAX protease family)